MKADNDHEPHLCSRIEVTREEMRRVLPDAYSAGRLICEMPTSEPIHFEKVIGLWRVLQSTLKIATGGMGNASRWFKT